MKQIINRNYRYGRGLFALLTTVLLLSGCGSSVTDSASTAAAANAATISGPGNPFTTPTGPAPSPTPGTTLPNPATAYFVIQGSTNAQVQGGTGNVGLFGPTSSAVAQKTTSLVLNTTNQLIVRVIAGESTGLATWNNNYNPSYDCVDYTVNVNGYSYQTNYLAAGGGVGGNNLCGATSTSQDLDFSTCILNRAVNSPVTIQVTAAQTDTRCENGWVSCNPVENLYWDYIAAGSLQVQVNGTQLSTSVANNAGVTKVCP